MLLGTLGALQQSVGWWTLLSHLSLASSVWTEILANFVSVFGPVSTEVWPYSSYIMNIPHLCLCSPINTPCYWCCKWLGALLLMQFSVAFLYYVVQISHHSPCINLSSFLLYHFSRLLLVGSKAFQTLEKMFSFSNSPFALAVWGLCSLWYF